MSVTVATLQMQSTPFAVERNLATAQRLIQQAASRQAQLVLLPELFHVGYSYDRRLRDFMEPVGGELTQWMLEMSRRFGVFLGGCIPERAATGCHDTFLLVSPDNEIYVYRKRYPAFFENLFFDPGDAVGILDTKLGRIGVMICWDMVHSRLVRELSGNVDLLLVSSAWPDLTRGNIAMPIVSRWMTGKARNTPALNASKLGVPVVFSNLTGEFSTVVPGTGLTYRTSFVGGSSIHDPRGRVLGKIDSEEGALVQSIEFPALRQRESERRRRAA